MPDAEIGGEQLPVKCRVFQLGGIKLLAEEGKRPPAAAAAATAGLPLLQDRSNVCVARISTAKLRSAAGSGWVRVATSAKVSLTSWKLCCMAAPKSSSSPPAARP